MMEMLDLIGLVIVIAFTALLFINAVILEALGRILGIFEEEETIDYDDD